MIKLAVFDWNGTLLADGEPIVRAVNQELTVAGAPPITLKIYQEYYEIPIVKFYKNIGISASTIEEKHMEMARVFHASYEPEVAKARTRSGTRQVLSTLRTKDVDSVVLSNHTSEGIYLQLERLKLGSYFKDVLANEDIAKNHHTGKEQRLADYLKANKIPAHEAVIIGDTEEEVKIARNLGMKVVVITGGYNSLARLKATKPDAIINKLSDLIKILEDF